MKKIEDLVKHLEYLNVSTHDGQHFDHDEIEIKNNKCLSEIDDCQHMNIETDSDEGTLNNNKINNNNNKRVRFSNEIDTTIIYDIQNNMNKGKYGKSAVKNLDRQTLNLKKSNGLFSCLFFFLS
jgi:hypothetical protein